MMTAICVFRRSKINEVTFICHLGQTVNSYMNHVNAMINTKLLIDAFKCVQDDTDEFYTFTPASVLFWDFSMLRRLSKYWQSYVRWEIMIPDSKIHGANMGLTWVLSALGGPHVGPINLANICHCFDSITISWSGGKASLPSALSSSYWWRLITVVKTVLLQSQFYWVDAYEFDFNGYIHI